MTTALKGVEESASHPGRSLPPEKTWYPLYRRLGGPQGRSGQVGKISPPPGFIPQTIQPIASRYTDYANRPTKYGTTLHLIKENMSCSVVSQQHKLQKCVLVEETCIKKSHIYFLSHKCLSFLFVKQRTFGLELILLYLVVYML